MSLNHVLSAGFVTYCLLGGITASADERKGVSPDSAALREMLPAIVDPSPATVAAAVNAYERMSPSAAADWRAVYALALIRTNQGRYEDARRLLAKLPEKPAAELPSLRLRLWLAVAKREPDAARPLFTELVKQTLNADTAMAHRFDTARFLGGLAGMLEPAPESSGVDAKLLAAAKDRLSAAQPSTVSALFQQSYVAAKERGATLATFIEEAQAQGPEKAAGQLAELETKVAQAKSEWATDQAQVETLVAEDKATDSAAVAKRKELSQGIGQLKIAFQKEITPGHPGPAPSPPAAPRAPQAPKGGPDGPSKLSQDFYQRDLAAFERAKLEYPAEVKAYEEKLPPYKAALDAWQVKENERRAALGAKKDAIDAELKALQDAQKDRDKALVEQRKQLAQRSNDLRLLTTRAQLWRAVVSGSADKEVSQLLVAPQNFPLLSLEAELERLKQAAK